MDAERHARMEAKGYLVVDDAADWLGLDEVDRRIVEFRLRVGREVRRRRGLAGQSQAQLAKSIGSSQSRIAKVEATADGVGVDLLLRSFFALGGQLTDLAAILSEEDPRPTPPGIAPTRKTKSKTAQVE